MNDILSQYYMDSTGDKDIVLEEKDCEMQEAVCSSTIVIRA